MTIKPSAATSDTHTPGPWVVDYEDGSIWNDTSGGFDMQIAMVTLCAFDSSGNTKQATANARLIAAAPELLAALEGAYVVLADFRHEWPQRSTHAGQALLCSMRDAICTATNREAESVQNDYGTRNAKARGVK